jgi:hypothetical protein
MTAAGLGMLLCVLPAAAAPQRARGSSPESAVAVQAERGRTPASLGLHGFSVVLVIGGTSAQKRMDALESELAALRAQGYSDRHPTMLRVQREIEQSRAEIASGKASQPPNSDVPEAARKALADMKDFLPYKRYQLLDAAWMLCCGPSRAAVSGQVRGPEGRDYQYTIDTLGTSESKLNLRFAMRETLDAAPAISGEARLSDTARLEHSRQLYEAIRERDEAEIAMRAAQKRFEVGVVAAPEMEAINLRVRRAQQRVQELQQVTASVQPVASGQSGGRGQGGARGQSAVRPSGPRTVMDSTFSIALGETVVIGTSRIMGDQALIAILTAAAKPGASR